jgi:hypothetical protein
LLKPSVTALMALRPVLHGQSSARRDGDNAKPV